MTDQSESAATPIAGIQDAFSSWAVYSKRSEILVHLTHEGLQRIVTAPKITQILHDAAGKEVPEQVAHAEKWKADQARREAATNFTTVHSHALLGLWGALECLIDDITIAMIHAHPELLDSPEFEKVKIPVSVLTMTDTHARSRLIYAEAAKNSKSDLTIGVGKFERILKLVNLSGAVPEKIRTAVFEAQQIRNVFAHKGGKMDDKFVGHFPRRDYVVGDELQIDFDTFSPLMHGIHMYAAVVINRYLVQIGKSPTTGGCAGYEGLLDDQRQCV